jgi:hypothetical protein
VKNTPPLTSIEIEWIVESVDSLPVHRIAHLFKRPMWEIAEIKRQVRVSNGLPEVPVDEPHAIYTVRPCVRPGRKYHHVAPDKRVDRMMQRVEMLARRSA